MQRNDQTGITARGQMFSNREVMIFGSGGCAQKIAANLAENGICAWLATEEPPPQTPESDPRIQWMADTRLVHCRGYAGCFSLEFEQKRQRLRKTVPAIVIAEDERLEPNYDPYGLTPGPRVISLSELERKMGRSVVEKTLFESGIRIGFLCGWENEAQPSVAHRMIEACLNLQKQAVQTYLFTGNLKVAATGCEALVQEAKGIGTVFFKFTGIYPSLEQKTNEGFTITYPEELTRGNLQVTVDWIVVDETIEPGHHLKGLIRMLDVDDDDHGFAQSDNVRRWSNATNRLGIFVAGGSRGMLSGAEQMSDADQVSLRVLSFLEGAEGEPRPNVIIHRGRCARCLTCHRLCPHNAIDIGKRITVVTQACQRCGICTAGCPGQAIEMEGAHFGPEEFKRILPPYPADSENEPPILIFGCSRSAGRSVELIRMSGEALPASVQFVEVPCAGTISASHLLAAFEAGAKGVLLCTCHTGNCQSEVGNQVAKKRANSITALLESCGIGSERLEVTSVAANMGHELARQIKHFTNVIQRMNNPLKENHNG